MALGMTCEVYTLGIVTLSILLKLISTMLQFLKTLLYYFTIMFVFVCGVYFYGHILIRFFVKIKLQDYFNIDHIANGITVLSVFFTLLSFWICHWYFKRLRAQKDD